MSLCPDHHPARPRVSVLIVVYNAIAEAQDCLASLAERTSSPIETIVVDNASPQGGAEGLARLFPQIRLIQNQENVGFARAVNQAAEASRGEYLLLLNPDARLLNDAVKLLADWLDTHPQAGLAGPRLVNPDGSLQTSTYCFPSLAQSAAHLFLLKKLLPLSLLRRLAPAWLGRRVGQLSRHDRPQPVDYCTGAALMLRRRVWEELGGLDERFFLYYEEKDLSLRAVRAGWQTWFVPAARVGHAIGASAETAPQAAALA
ncbi:MAG: glycosyltransferase family 2 protein, partial [Deltaproteobacteria bacterium]|nr:glycosyltransferase family 2 protein [Deltaproteobacteria bacterium]